MPETSLHRILIDERWSLVDLYQFPHAYTHVYGFIYSLTQTDSRSEASVAQIYRRHPWRGGYSTVNFYGDLYYAMGEEHQPTVKSIRYSSPGFIEIATVTVAVVSQLETIVKILANAINHADTAFDEIYRRTQKRKLLSIDVKRNERKFNQEEIVFMVNSAKELSNLLKFEDLEKLQSRTQNDLATLKIMLSFYRRARELTEFYLSGKVRFEGGEPFKIELPESASTLTVGRRYSRKEISALLGGGKVDFLPTKKNRIVCGCFTLERNPEAPDIVIPGTGKGIERKAKLFCKQNFPVPIFIKHRTNEWEYVGDYKAVRCSNDPVEIAAHHKGSITPLAQITSVIFLQHV